MEPVGLRPLGRNGAEVIDSRNPRHESNRNLDFADALAREKIVDHRKVLPDGILKLVFHSPTIRIGQPRR